ncbi:TPA: EscF/YscF/HrpA family type III secretion system needle major subunit [Yersinia enterocolitica]
MALDGLDATGKWNPSALEMPDTTSKGHNMGMIYRALGALNTSVGEHGNKLAEELKKKDIEIDNPVKLAEISILSSNFNFARQLQSNLMKTFRDTTSTCIRNA